MLVIAPGQEALYVRVCVSFRFSVTCCVFSLESSHRGNSTEYTQYTTFSIKQKIILNYPELAVMRFFLKGLKNEFETAVVNKPSVFEPLKFYCTTVNIRSKKIK